MQEILRLELDTIIQSKNLDTYELSPDVNTIVEEYINFIESTKNGKQGQTAQYWLGNIQMLHLYHEFARSIRTGDIDVYIY